MPHPNKGESKTSPRRLAAHDKHLRALALRKAGYNFRAIAKELGYNDQAAAHKAVMGLLKSTAREAADEVRTMELDRLDDWLSRIAKRIASGELAAIETGLKVQARRAKLLGLDAPEKIAPTTPDGTATYEPLSEADREARILQIVARAKQRAKQRAKPDAP